PRDDRGRQIPDVPCRWSRRRMLAQIDCDYFRDEEFLGPSRTTRWPVVFCEIGLERFFSSCAIITACARANLTRSVENDEDAGSVVATTAEVKSGGQSTSGHIELDTVVMVAEA